MYDEICYDKPFLKEVVSRIDFVAPIETIQNSLNSKFLKAISKLFPISEPTEELAQELQFGPGHLSSKEIRTKQWNFYSKNRESQLTIARNCVFVLYKKYENYEKAQSDFSYVIDAFSKAYPDAQVSRYGLRYINIIEIPDINPVSGWSNYINEDLLSGHSIFGDESVVRLFHITEIIRDDLSIRFQYGIANPDHPAIVRQPQFVMDIDAYIQTSHGLAESLSYMDQAHRHIQDLFEKSITDQLRGKMHVRPAES
jgi:uncharacterized protein (TIGR04255 family)